MAGFELDMNFSVEQLAGGLERLLEKRGMRCSRREENPGEVTLSTDLGGRETRIHIQPTPAHRLPPLAFPPRTLVAVESTAGAAALEELRRDIVLAFLRVTG